MKIISKFKDYYDYVAHTYGGGDPKIIYNRSRLGELHQVGSVSYTRTLEVEFSLASLKIPFRHIHSPLNSYYGEYGFRWLSVCGKPYPLINVDDKVTGSLYQKHELFNFQKHKHLLDPRDWGNKIIRLQIGVERRSLVELSKKIGHPVFEILHHGNKATYINGDCPILGNLGFASVYPAEQLYQDLSYFIVNKMKDSPDLAPRIEISDKEKITQHGFDVKQSFRHRK